MRLPAIALLCAFTNTSVARAQSPTAQEIIERAIKAEAEKPEDLSKRRIERSVMEGKFNEQPIVREIIAEWPARVRYNLLIKTPQGDTKIEFALNGSSAWRLRADTGLQELDFNHVDEFRSEIHGRWVATLLPFKDGKFTLTLMPENRVSDEEVYVVKAAMRFRPEVLMFFSKKSGLLLKVSYKATEEGTPVRKEHVFGDYKKFNGLLLPGKMTDYQNSNLMAEFTIKEYKFLDKQPAGTFDKPNGK